ncbi:MAG: tyrosine-type recombinase/integrase [Dermatophilaceae bacterium]
MIRRPVSGKPIDRRDVHRMVTRIAKTAGIPRHISPDSLRHAAITNALDAGVPLRDAQILAGTPTPAPPSITTAPAATSTHTACTSSPPTSPGCSPTANVVTAGPQVGRLRPERGTHPPSRRPCADAHLAGRARNPRRSAARSTSCSRSGCS